MHHLRQLSTEDTGANSTDAKQPEVAEEDIDLANDELHRERLSDGSEYVVSVVRGERFPVFVSERGLREVDRLMLPDGCSILDTFPKSGTTLTQRVVQVLQGRQDEKITTVAPWLEEAYGPSPVSTPLARSARKEYQVDMGGCTVFKSHSTWANVKKQPRLRYIYVARNGRDVAVSMFHHTRAYDSYEFHGTWEVFLEELFLNGRTESGSWFRHVREWWEVARRWPEQVLFLWYEDFLSDPETYVRQVSDWIGLEADDELIRKTVEQTSFKIMKEDPMANYAWTNERRHPGQPQFLRKGVAGDWRKYFTERQNQLFQERFDQEFADCPDLVKEILDRQAETDELSPTSAASAGGNVVGAGEA